MLNHSFVVKQFIRLQAKIYDIQRDETDSIVFIANYLFDKCGSSDQNKFLEILRREFEHASNRSCGSVHYDKIANYDIEDDDKCKTEDDDSQKTDSIFIADNGELENWRVAETPALQLKVQRLLDASAGGASTAEMTVKMSRQQRAVQTQLDVLTERLGGYAFPKRALPRNAPVAVKEVEASPVDTWSAEKVAETYDEATTELVNAVLKRRAIKKYVGCVNQVEVEGVPA